MRESKPKVIVIPAAPKNTGTAEQRQLRVAAYCRVSTKEEDQLNSYEAQKNYYTDKIMANKSWTMATFSRMKASPALRPRSGRTSCG